jgi:hypothetical protein
MLKEGGKWLTLMEVYFRPKWDNPCQLQKGIFFSHFSTPAVYLNNVNVIPELETPGVNFIYLKEDTEIMKIIESLGNGTDETSFKEMSSHLQGLLEPSIAEKIITPGSTPGSRVNFNRFKKQAGADAGQMHLDAAPSAGKLLAVWVALVDMETFAFTKTHENFNIKHTDPQHTSYDPQDEFFIVPGMKKGEMLMFEPNFVIHGSPIVSENDGGRDAVSFFFSS